MQSRTPNKTKQVKTPVLHLGCWDVRTMTFGLTDNQRKNAVINIGLRKRQFDTWTLQETRLHSSGSLWEQDYAFFWQEHSAGSYSTTHRQRSIVALCLNTTMDPSTWRACAPQHLAPLKNYELSVSAQILKCIFFSKMIH